MQGMFCGSVSLKNINLSSFKTDKVIDMPLLFHECELLK